MEIPPHLQSVLLGAALAAIGGLYRKINRIENSITEMRTILKLRRSDRGPEAG